MVVVAVSVAPDGQGHSAFGHDETGKRHRLSPTWIRDVHEDRLQTFEVPSNRPGVKAKIDRMAPFKVGRKLVTGETLYTATERAVRALKLLAKGLPIEVPKEKKL